jgi:hypothetical protein
MPLATVRIVLDNTDVVYYETKADDKAFYSISPKFLPILPYHIEYSPANVVPAPANTIKVTLPDFVKKNKEYHDANLIKPMTGTKNGVQVDPGAYVKNKNQAQNGSGNEGGQNGGEPGMYNKGGLKGGSALENLARATGQSSSTLLIVLIILFIVVAATLVMYIRNQRSSLMSSKNSEDYDDEEPEEMV